MTKRKARPGQGMGLLKGFLAVGAVAATLLGTRLLTGIDGSGKTAVSVPNPETITKTVNQQVPPEKMALDGDFIVIDLAPVPQAVTPNIQPILIQPVTRTRTS